MLKEYEILDKVIEDLKNSFDLELEPVEREVRISSSKGMFRADYILAVKYPTEKNEDEKDLVVAEVKQRMTSTTVIQMLGLKSISSKQVMLITQQVSLEQADKLREADIFFADMAGNLYLRDKGFCAFVSGKKTEIVKEKKSRLFDKAGLKIIFALLNDDSLVEKDMRTIAKESGVASVSTVSDIFKDLKKRRYLIQSGLSKRKLTNKSELLRRWVENYAERLRPTLKQRRFVSQKYQGRWWEEVKISDYNAVWGGETGAEILTKHLKPEKVTIYSDSNLPLLQAKYGLVRDERGNVEILEKFWTSNETGDVAPPLLVYADLMATGDERNLETAQLIYEKFFE